MTKGDIDGLTIFGRPLKPVALGLTLTMIVVAQSNLRGADRGTMPPLSWIVAGVSVAAVLCLLWGWFGKQQHAAEVGLLLVVAAYTTRAAFIWFSSGWDQAVFFSLSTVIIAGGSYALEVSERRRWGRREG